MRVLNGAVRAIVCGLCLGSSHASLDVSTDALTVPAQVQIVQGQAPPAIQVSFSYPNNKCRGDVAFTWDSQAWGSAPVAPADFQTCTASLAARPPAGAAGAGQHTVCASSSSAGDCKTLTLVVPAPKPTQPTPTPKGSTPPPSPSPLTGVLMPDLSPSPDVTASSRPMVRKAGGVSAWAGTGFAILLGVVAIGGFGLAMRSMVRGGPPA